MVKVLRWIGRILFVVGVLGLLACGAAIVSFVSWKHATLAALDAGSQIADVDAGKIEFALKGEGPVVLICHGAPGGYDQAELIGREFVAAGYQVVAPSRPGFLRTPLATGLTFADQADALDELLDTLGFDQVVVVGFSTGAPVAAQFAIRHGDRTRGVVLISPVTRQYWRDPEKQPQLLAETALYKTSGDMGSWVLVETARRDPASLLEAVFESDTTLDAAGRARLAHSVVVSPAQLKFFQDLIGTLAPLSPRESGTRNDLLLLKGWQPLPYESMRAPTLLIQGKLDANTPWVTASDIVGKAPNAQLVTIEGAGHLVWLAPKPATMRDAIVNFLSGLPASAPSAAPSGSAPAPAAN